MFVSVLPNRQLFYSIGRNFCLEGNKTIPEYGVTINCTLEQMTVPPPMFNMIITRVFSNGTNETLQTQPSETGILSINSSLLSSLFEEDAVLLKITCDVSNDYGSDTMFTNIRICSGLS